MKSSKKLATKAPLPLNDNVAGNTGMNADIIVVGGGLAGGLTALRLAQIHPEKKTLLLDRGPSLGGNHTWSFHEAELGELWMQPLISKSWDSHEVRFPKHSRVIDGRYHSIRSSDFHRALTEKLGRNVRLGCDVKQISATDVECATGEILRAPLVIDACGIRSEQTTSRTFAGSQCGWLKFIGYDFKLKKPHGLTRPILTDATVPQMDGYRYFYCLPWDEHRILVEETFYSSKPELNRERISRSLVAYAERSGWDVESIERKEEGCLPLPQYALEYDMRVKLGSETDGEDFIDNSPVSISSGVGWFHSTTGHSLPDAVRIAEFISSLPQLRTGPVRAELREFRKEWVEQQRFFRLLNRLLFRAVEPSLRYLVLERFYNLREDLIARFFAGTSTRADQSRILGAKPVVRPGRITKNWADDQPSTVAAEA